ncbi:MAG: methylated-DNA--[protein]-cysteine S-methyltransferase [Synergistaceae bacterium]|nr:methylated-DNA--[protein]-cysteine S-methyltransferase [Synergistaceae bacterium]
MQYTTHYDSPLGGILLAADEKGLTGLWFDGEKYYAGRLSSEHQEGSLPVLDETKRWLDVYFSGREPDFMPALHVIGSAFQLSVWKILRKIPYGKTTTYGAIAKEIANQRKLARMSAQAVGGAVGHNEISILIPCHRVIGSGGSLTGYAGGVDKKDALLRLEGVDMTGLTIPVAGTAVQSWWGADE